VQEELVQGTSDLLGTLDQEIQSCDFEIHIIGDAAGARPRENELEKLRARHPGFLDAYQKLKEHLQAWNRISYTQWEAYLAFHHDKKRLIFKAEQTAPRNPEYVIDPEEKEAQAAHLSGIRSLGEHYQFIHSQSDLVIKTIRSILTSQSIEPSTGIDPKELASRVEAVLRKKSKEPAESHDPGRIDQYFRAVEETSKDFGIERSTALKILDEYSRLRKDALGGELAIEVHRELTELALAKGEYQEAIIEARRWIDQATQLLSVDPEGFEATRELLLDGYQYWHDAAVLSGNLEEAVIAVKDGLRHIDRDLEPLAWADFIESLFRSAKASSNYELADEVLDSIIDVREEHQAGSLELAKALYEWSEILFQKGNFKGAIDVAARVLSREFEEVQIVERRFALMVRNTYGFALLSGAKYDSAETVLRRCLAEIEGFYGPTHPYVATSLNNLALLLSETNRKQEAEPLIRRSLLIGESSLGPDHPGVATSLNNLALLLSETNRHGEAEPLVRQSLSIREASLGPDHPDVAASLNSLARLLFETNRTGEAESLYRRALSIREASLGPDHPNVATSLDNLASLLSYTNRTGEAEPLYRRTLSIREASLGPDHPYVATSLNNLASLLSFTNRRGEAEPLYRRTLSIVEASLGPDHPDVATSLDNLANLLSYTDRTGEAEPLYRRAFSIREASLGPDHPDVAISLNNLASLLSDTNRTGEAEPLYRRALRIREASLGPDHPDVATSLNTLARLLSDTNRTGEAEPLVRRALRIREVSLGPDHPDVATSLNNLARLLSDTNRKDEAEPLFRRALQILINYRKSTGYSYPKYESFKTSYSDHLKSLGYSPEKIDQTLEEIAAEVMSKQSSSEDPPFE
jgi:tetratricopeptide (TPR) repeat protein